MKSWEQRSALDVCPNRRRKGGMERWEEKLGGWVVTERFVSQAPMGMSREEKDIRLSKVRVKSPGRGILGIWFRAGNFSQTSRIPNSFVITSEMICFTTEACVWVWVKLTIQQAGAEIFSLRTKLLPFSTPGWVARSSQGPIWAIMHMYSVPCTRVSRQYS